jgi:hypothetical protein
VSKIRQFPVNTDTKLKNILKDFSKTLDREFGVGTYASYVTIIHAPGIGTLPEDEVETTSYRFTQIPEGIKEDDEDAFLGLLYKAMSKDPNIGGSVINLYAQKFAEFVAIAMAHEDEEEGKGAN